MQEGMSIYEAVVAGSAFGLLILAAAMSAKVTKYRTNSGRLRHELEEVKLKLNRYMVENIKLKKQVNDLERRNA